MFAIADPHLGASVGHSMRAYGGAWAAHPVNLFANWDAAVPAEGVVLVPGDLSAASRAQDISSDYGELHARSGALKVLSPGNHDYCWKTQSQARRLCEPYPSLLALKGQAVRLTAGADELPGVVVLGACGAPVPGSEHFDASAVNAARYAKTVRKLPGMLQNARALLRDGDRLLVALHYPPFGNLSDPSPISEMVQDAGASLCVFGHIHTADEHARVFQGVRDGCAYRLVAADYLNMTPALLGTLHARGFTLSGE